MACVFLWFYRWQNIQNEFIRVEEEVSKAKEFRGLDEFAVVYQPWSTKLSVYCKNNNNFKILIKIMRYYCYFFKKSLMLMENMT